MILNTGGRTDTVNYFSEWLLRRFREGFVYSRNPFNPDVVSSIRLDPATIDVVEFCSKNYRPILPRLHEITDRFNCHFHYTITAYGKDVEPRVPTIDESIETLKELARQVGRERIVWRYDPVLLTRHYTVERHIEIFARMAGQLAPYVDRVLFSFVVWYKKLAANMPDLLPISESDKIRLARAFGEIARKNHLTIQTCGTIADYTPYGILKSGCMTREIFEHALDLRFRNMPQKGNRPGCRCMESRGLGDYNTCINGCRYCYANSDPRLAMANYALHDPESPLMTGHIKPTDLIRPLRQESFLDKEPRLF